MMILCIMEVRPGQRSSTIAQALAHNTSTVERDLDMFRPLLLARGELALLSKIEEAHEHLKAAYAGFLEVFAEEVTVEVRKHGDHDHGDHAGERVHHEDPDHLAKLLAQAHHDATLARRYETR